MHLMTYRRLPYPANLWSAIVQKELAVDDVPKDWENTIHLILSSLENQRNAEIVRCYFKNGCSLATLSNVYGLSREGVRQCIIVAMEQLRHPVRLRVLKTGLLRADATTEEPAMPISGGVPGHFFCEETSKKLPVAELNLGARAYNCLRRNAINSIGELLELTELEVMNMRGMGVGGLAEIKQRLAQCGFKLKREEPKHNCKQDKNKQGKK